MKLELQKEACLLRQQGMSVKSIARKLNVSQSSVSLWVRGIELSTEQKQELDNRRRRFGSYNAGARANSDRNKQLRLTYQQKGRLRAKEMNPLHLTGCMLYWAEGAKTRNGIYFVNSDPNMVVLFMKFIREELNVANIDIALRIHCHTSVSTEIARIEQYWVDLLGLAPSNVKKTYIKAGGDGRKNILQNGVCDIRVHSTELVQHIYGAIQEYGGFENPGWLF